MKNIIIVVLLLGAFGAGGLYLKKRMNDKEKEDNAGTKVIDRKGKKGPAANKPTAPTADKQATPPAATAADAGAAAKTETPAAKTETPAAKTEAAPAKTEEAKKEMPAPK